MVPVLKGIMVNMDKHYVNTITNASDSLKYRSHTEVKKNSEEWNGLHLPIDNFRSQGC